MDRQLSIVPSSTQLDLIALHPSVKQPVPQGFYCTFPMQGTLSELILL
jgi:hypothetical protein